MIIRALFRNLVKAIAAVVDEGCFDKDGEKIKLLAMDPSHFAMVDFELPEEFFDGYLCEGEPWLSLRIGEFLKFLNRVERDERVKIRLEEEQGRLSIQCTHLGHTHRFTMPVFEPLDEEVPPPKILFKASARILTQGLRRAFRDAGLVSEHMKIEVVGDLLKMSAVGEIGSVFSDWERGADELLDLKAEEDSDATFTRSYLRDVVNAAGTFSEGATLELAANMPIKMGFELPQGKLVYYIAPCISA